ncbi:MAG TPA: hypothetical protein VMP41_08365 [Acidimicrobiales bacterium]|nr:hypothetical protein [Acidimicrobiales bacterium]
MALLALWSAVLLSSGAGAAGAGTAPARAPSGSYAPPDTPGPPLDVPASQLDSALTCSATTAAPTRDIILVLPPTLFDPGEAYDWNYLPAFAARGWPYCQLTVPDHSDGDIQVAAEYVVNAVRVLYAFSGRQVELFGWSQGASTLPRWALRWWPDIRPMVASLVGLAPDNEYGTTDPAIESVCAYECFPAAWQETHRLIGGESNFMAAMNSDEQTFPGIAYTDIWSELDEVAGWNIGSDKVSPLPPAPNVLDVSTQSLCPLQVDEHLTIPADGAAYAVAMAALAAPGQLPDLAAIDRTTVCPQLLMPFVTPLSLTAHETQLVALVGERATVGMVTSEPPLRCYVTASCESTPGA